MPIQNYAGFKRMTSFCRTAVPQAILDALEPIQHDDERVKAYGVQLGKYRVLSIVPVEPSVWSELSPLFLRLLVVFFFVFGLVLLCSNFELTSFRFCSRLSTR